MILTAIPKSGIHCLHKACKLLGFDLPMEHREYTPGIDAIYIHRDHRNMIVSAARYFLDRSDPEALIRQIHDFMGYGRFKDVIEKYRGWFANANVISYEFLNSQAGIERLASFLGVKAKGDEFEKLPGGTETWSGEPSDWRKYWSYEVEEHFKQCS